VNVVREMPSSQSALQSFLSVTAEFPASDHMVLMEGTQQSPRQGKDENLTIQRTQERDADWFLKVGHQNFGSNVK